MIDEIVHKSGLPLEYLEWMQCPNLTGLARRDYSVAKLSSTYNDFILNGLQSNWTTIHSVIIQEVQSLPSAHLLGQAVLLRDPNGRTAMLSIAEAAFIQLNGLCELLELVIMMIEHAARDKSAETRWQLNQQQLTLKETSSHGNARLQSSNLGLQQESKTLHALNWQNTVPSFLKTKAFYRIEDIEGTPLNVEIHAKLDKGFFQVDPGYIWTCYRRNFFSVDCAYTLEPIRDVNLGTLRLRRSGIAGYELIQIQAFAMCISANVDGEDGKVVGLLQHKTSPPDKVKLSPISSTPLGRYEGNNSAASFSQSSNYAPPSAVQQQIQTVITFDRMQFKNATANKHGEGKSKAQQYFHLVVELFAAILDSETSETPWVMVNSRISDLIVVRGRSPGHYEGVGGSTGYSWEGFSAKRANQLRSIPIEPHINLAGMSMEQSVPIRRTSDGAQPEFSPKNVDLSRKLEEPYEHIADLIIRKESPECSLVTRLDDRYLREVIKVDIILQWLKLVLGGTDETEPISDYFQTIDLKQENLSREQYSEEYDDITRTNLGCWRSKVRGDRILESCLIKPLKYFVGNKTYGQLMHQTPAAFQDFASPFPDLDDGLILTAAALWSLFDNSVERIPNCQCTFESEGGDCIQCIRKDEQAFLWHVFTSDALLCRGFSCPLNVRIALGPKDSGDRLFTTSLCILSWTAESRTTPEQPIASKFSVTSGFVKGRLTKYEQESLEVQAHLSVPAVVTPQVSFATMFSKRRYKVANSIEEASIIATDIASTSTVLIYCETRGLHLMMYGADLIEGICIELLKKLLCTGLPKFIHDNALSRMQTWQNSSFVSATRNVIPGEELVRQAAKRIHKLTEATNTAASDLNGKLSYWVLEHLLCGRDTQAIKAPNRHIHTSWHAIAHKSPPLILAVGEIDARLIARELGPLLWIKKSGIRKRSDLKSIADQLLNSRLPNMARYGAVLGTKEALARWLQQTGIAFCGRIEETADRVCYGNGTLERTYRMLGDAEGTVSAIPTSMGCNTCYNEDGVQCLYYLQ